MKNWGGVKIFSKYLSTYMLNILLTKIPFVKFCFANKFNIQFNIGKCAELIGYSARTRPPPSSTIPLHFWVSPVLIRSTCWAYWLTPASPFHTTSLGPCSVPPKPPLPWKIWNLLNSYLLSSQ